METWGILTAAIKNREGDNSGKKGKGLDNEHV